jgi:D-alanyl-D-alanine carboxypeptidase
MNRRTFLIRTAAVTALAAFNSRNAHAAKSGEPESADDLLAGVLKAHSLPALSAAAFRDGHLIARGTIGLRDVTRPDDPVTPDDRFAIGSCTKRMTALMACRLIDAGQFSFDTTLADALPDIPMRDDYRPATITQLISFRAGLPAYTNITPEIAATLSKLKGTPIEQREQFIRHVLQEAPAVKPDTERLYSNATYALLAFVCAKRTNSTWEELIQEHVFTPLHMTHSAFGRPRTPKDPHQPRLHTKTDTGYTPRPDDAPDPLAPLSGAGGINCSATDLATFAACELAAAQGKDPLLTPATNKRWRDLSMNRPEGSPIVGGTPFLNAAYAIWPSKNFAAAVATNAGGAIEACRAVLDALHDRYAA